MKTFFTFLLSLCCLTATAQQEHITFVVPFTPGGGTDITARKLAPYVTKATGTPVVVESRPGANSSIGTHFVINSAPNGKTVLITSVAAMEGSTAGMATAPYDWQKDLRPVAIAVPLSPYVLLTSKKYTSFQQFKTALENKPINFGSPIVNGVQDMLTNMLLKTTGNQNKNVQTVLYKGTNPVLNDVVSGELDATFATAHIVHNLVAAGKVNVLAVTGSKRLDYLPDVPTFRELGLPKVNIGIDYFGLWVPSATPDSVVEELRNVVYTYAKNGGELHKEFVEMKFADPNYQVPRDPTNEQNQTIRTIRSNRTEYFR